MSDEVIISIIHGLVSVIGVGITAYVTYKLGRIHKQLNSRMDQLLEAAQVKGNVEGRKDLLMEQSKEK